MGNIRDYQQIVELAGDETFLVETDQGTRSLSYAQLEAWVKEKHNMYIGEDVISAIQSMIVEGTLTLQDMGVTFLESENVRFDGEAAGMSATNVKEALDFLSKRIDQFVKTDPEESENKDPELIALRVSVDGSVYETAAEAIRIQFSKLFTSAANQKSELDSVKEDIAKIKESMPPYTVDKASGKTVTLTDCDDKKIRGLKVYGMSNIVEQFGKNLLDVLSIPFSRENGGFYFYSEYGGAIVFNGQAYSETISICESFGLRLDPGTYTFSVDHCVSGFLFSLSFTLKGGAYKQVSFGDKERSVTVTFEDEVVSCNRFIVHCDEGVALRYERFFIQAEKGRVATEFEPYGSSVTRQIESVGDTGTISIYTENKGIREYFTIDIGERCDPLMAAVVESGGNLLFNGKRYLADTLEYEEDSVKIVRRTYLDENDLLVHPLDEEYDESFARDREKNLLEQLGEIRTYKPGTTIGISEDTVFEVLYVTDGSVYKKGLSPEAKNLLLSILENASYSSDQTESIEALRKAFE